MSGGGIVNKQTSGKLEKFTKNKKQKQILAFSLVGLVLLIGAIKFYRTFALYEQKLEFNVLHGRVPEYDRPGDVKIVAIIDGEKSSTIPSKDDGYKFESITCDNDATARWDNDEWGIFVKNLTKSKTTCTLSFVSSNLINYITYLEKDSEDLAYDGTVDNNLRYIGANPNNYVLFNNELWRIIGVMNNVKDSTGKIESHVKIIRNEGIGDYYWSGSSSNTSNDWTKSTLNTETLNGTYYNRLTNDTKSMISNVVWNLGGTNDSNLSSSAFYTVERGTTVYSNNATTWTGKIGLMYPSDYGYAVGGNERDMCLESNLSTYRVENCYTNDWMFLTEIQQWTIISSSSLADFAFYIGNAGHVSFKIDNSVYTRRMIVRPTLYLNSNVGIIADETHNGSEEHPYLLKLS